MTSAFVLRPDAGVESTGRVHRWLPLAYFAVSVLILIPCYWSRHIQAGDLGSHMYNAWLKQHIDLGRLPGLYVVPQVTNVLFDRCLDLLLRIGSFEFAERAAVSLCVLVFFWGSFAFVSSQTGKRPWVMVPCLSMLAYGWVFHMGFFNFYLSLGLCLWSLSLLRRFTWPRGSVAVALLLLAGSAHVIPPVWALFVWLYSIYAAGLRGRRRAVLPIAAFAVIILARFGIASRYPVLFTQTQVATLFGIDQVWVFGWKYFFISVGLLGWWTLLLARSRFTAGYAAIPASLVAINALAAVMIPTAIQLPQFQAPVNYIAERMSLTTGILVCCLLAEARARLVETGLVTGLCAVFFCFLFADTVRIDKFEDRLASVVNALPPGRRVLAGFRDNSTRVNSIGHVLDRACIGHCFSYANYEPATAQFRIRALDGNPFVLSRAADIFAVQEGRYIVREQDKPLYQVRPCNVSDSSLCTELLRPGSSATQQPMIFGR